MLHSDKTFSENSRTVAIGMVEYIRSTFKAKLDTLSWMDAETVAKAKEKADMINVKVLIKKVLRYVPSF